jgi:vancomycin resistance protein VanJ
LACSGIAFMVGSSSAAARFHRRLDSAIVEQMTQIRMRMDGRPASTQYFVLPRCQEAVIVDGTTQLPDRPGDNRARRLMVVALMGLTWSYLVAVVVAWLLLRFAGDRWWFATVMLFGPRWFYAVPWLVLAPLVLWLRPRLFAPLAIAAVVLIGPIMGLCLPWARLMNNSGHSVRVLTCNVDGSAVDVNRLAALVNSSQPDLVALQECPVTLAPFWPKGWHQCRMGEFLIASPYPLRNADLDNNGRQSRFTASFNGLRCAVTLPWGNVSFCCVHLHTPRSGLSEALDRRTVVSPARSARLERGIASRRLESEALAHGLRDWPGPWIVAGDFNMPTDSAIYRDSWSGYVNAFSVAGFGFGYTKWTPIRGLCYGTRIDHILGGPDTKVRKSWVGPDIGSDHLPLLADLIPPAGTNPGGHRMESLP